MSINEEIKRNRLSLAYRYAFRAGFRPVKHTETPDQNNSNTIHHAVHLSRGNETVQLYKKSIDGRPIGHGGAIYTPGDGGKEQHFGFSAHRLVLSPFVKLGGIGDFRLLMQGKQ